MKKIGIFAFLIFLAFEALVFGQAYEGGPIINNSTVATLPVQPQVGQTRQVTDGSTAAGCTVGGGSFRVLCRYTGTTWEAVGGGFDPASPGNIGSTTPGTGKFTTLQWTTSFTGPMTDYQFIPIDAGMDSVIAAPDAAIRVQGVVGSTIAPTPANVTYGTFTVSAPNVTTAVYVSGTQTATLTITPVVVGKLYQLNLTPTVTGQVPTITATSGIGNNTIPTVVAAVVETIYFRATATTAVFTFTNTAASTWSTASTTCFEYTRPTIAREFSHTAQQSLVFSWEPPGDWDGGTITVIPYMVVTNATPPAQTETVIWSISGFAVSDSDSLSQATGTAQASTFTEATPATHIQYNEVICPATAAITLANTPAAGKIVRIILDRLTSDAYAQKIGLTKIRIKFTRTLAP